MVLLRSSLILRPSLGLGAFISLSDHCQGLSEWGWPFNAPRARTLIKSHPGRWRLAAPAKLHSAIPSEAEPRVSHTQAFQTHARHIRHEFDILFSLGAWERRRIPNRLDGLDVAGWRTANERQSLREASPSPAGGVEASKILGTSFNGITAAFQHRGWGGAAGVWGI